MNPDPSNSEPRPTPEELSAYVDGELPPTQMGATAAWLLDHPDVDAEVQWLQRLAALCQEHGPPEPTNARWDQTWQGIEGRLGAPKPTPKTGGGWVKLRFVLGLAAACVAALLLARGFWPQAKPLPVDDEEPYPVAGADEIVIISMDPHNLHNLVVGKPPIHDALVLADMDDVQLIDAKPNDEGQVPDMRQGGRVPVILPTVSWGGKDED